MEKDDVLIFEPDPRLFEQPTTSAVQRVLREKQVMFVFNGVTTPKTGGIYTKFLGMPYPEPGIKFAAAGIATATVKKFMLGIFQSILSFSLSIFIERLAEACNIFMGHLYMKKQFYTEATRGVRQLVYLFLKFMGCSPIGCSLMSKVICHFVQYDDAYYYRLKDIFSMTTKERLMKQPIREVLRLFKLYKRREHADDMKLGSIFKLLSFALLIPKVRRAFKKAIELTDFSLLTMDKRDIYFTLIKGKYDYCGYPVHIRQRTYLQIHKNQPPPMIEMWYE